MVEVYLCRHGETEWTLSGQHTSSTDIPLTSKGRQQAHSLGVRLKGIAFSKVYSSPMKRALETCKVAGFQPTIEPLAVEWNYGDYEGLDHAQIVKQNPKWDLFTQGSPGGESPQEIGARADHLIETILRQSGPIALFSHGHFLRVFAARWAGLKPEQAQIFILSVASVSILGYERAHRAVKLWNDTSFM
ncbi:MAG: histidine phosphatase family protein [Verrucomicrobia bacterium]|nr:histidine phosphatase family protein [Verrucomicrobiota bacterium]